MSGSNSYRNLMYKNAMDNLAESGKSVKQTNKSSKTEKQVQQKPL